jgi:hypothetical protein
VINVSTDSSLSYAILRYIFEFSGSIPVILSANHAPDGNITRQFNSSNAVPGNKYLYGINPVIIFIFNL